MIFISAQRLIGVASSAVSKIGSISNIFTISIYQKNTNKAFSRYQCTKVCSVFNQNIVLDNITKRSYTNEAVIVKKMAEKFPMLQMKKRPLRKKRLISDDEEVPQPGVSHALFFVP